MFLLGLGRLIVVKVLSQVLSDPEMKAAIVRDLKAAAASTDNKIDDKAVDVFDSAWDIVVPTVVQRIKSKPGQTAPLNSIKL